MNQFNVDELKAFRSMNRLETIKYWNKAHGLASMDGGINEVIRLLCLTDLFYLLVSVCGRDDMNNDFAFARCREVEANPDNYLDLWAREHFKSSVITFGLTIQDILKEPEITFGIFSHTRPIAKAFLRQIMREFEANQILHAAFPDVLWGMDLKQSPKWSEDEGIVVKRKSNPKEATVEAWGLVDGQPTSKHYKILLYDDIVVQGSVSTPEMIAKTMTALEQSYNLGVSTSMKRRFVGTRWHFNDAYRTIKDRGTAIPREHPGRIGGVEEGESVFWADEIHRQKRRDMGPYTYAAQILLNPKADALQGFKREWLSHYATIDGGHEQMNKYILVDSANSKKKGSDYTAMWVIGLNYDGNYYVLDMVRDRMTLTERADRIFTLHQKWKPLEVRWEKYGMMADIEHITREQDHRNYRFKITDVAGQTSKEDRIKRLLPLFEQGKIYLPKSFHVTDWQKNVVDLVHSFIEEEYMAFPVGSHDDGLDALARIAEPDLPLQWPMQFSGDDEYQEEGSGRSKFCGY